MAKKWYLDSEQNPLIFNYIFKFSNSMMDIIWSQIYSIHSNFSMFVGIFKIID